MKAKIEVDIDELNLILVSLTQHSEYVRDTILKIKKQGTDQFIKMSAEQKADNDSGT